jgi:hypothetical protein
MVFQDNNLFAHLDIRTNVGLGLDPALRLDAAAWSRVEAALERVGLAGFWQSICRRRSQAANASVWRWPAPSPVAGPCCFSMSRLTASDLVWPPTCCALMLDIRDRGGRDRPHGDPRSR